jgi:hypothetical protein
MEDGSFYKALWAVCHPFPSLVSDTEYSYYTKSQNLVLRPTSMLPVLSCYVFMQCNDDMPVKTPPASTSDVPKKLVSPDTSFSATSRFRFKFNWRLYGKICDIQHLQAQRFARYRNFLDIRILLMILFVYCRWSKIQYHTLSLTCYSFLHVQVTTYAYLCLYHSPYSFPLFLSLLP